MYCNYSKDKFGKELTFIIPCWLDILEGQSYWYDGFGYRVGADIRNQNFGYIKKSSNYNTFLYALENAEKSYLLLLNEGWTPQQARSVLPLGIKSELISCGFEDAWENFMRRRDAPDAHPMAQEIAKPMHEEFLKLTKV